MTKVYVNGQWLEAQEARIAVDSRIVRLGDGVFETVPVFHGQPYLWHYHSERLNAGLEALRIARPRGLHDNILTLIKENSMQDGMIRVAVSRGGGSQGYLPSPYPSTAAPVVIIETLPRPALPTRPLSLWLSSYEKISPRALPVQCKLSQGLNPALARMEAQDHGCDEALQLGAGGSISEASSATIFWRRNNMLYTPSLACGALAGVTRRRLMELSRLPVKEGSYTLEDLQAADAVILCNAARGIMPVQTLLPQGWNWESDALARELNALREADIAREALA